MRATLELVYRAAQAGPVMTPAGKAIAYGPAPHGDLAGRCYLCGEATDEGLPRRDVIKPTFTDHGIARDPDSDLVCPLCTWALSYSELRNYSILATPAGLRHPSRSEIRDVLLHPPAPPFVLTIAVSGQKWLHIKARVVYNRAAFSVLLEETPVLVRPTAVAALLDTIEELYSSFTKAEIETGDYQPHRIRRFGIKRWERLEEQIGMHRGSRLFDLLLHVAQKQTEEVEQGVLRL